MKNVRALVARGYSTINDAGLKTAVVLGSVLAAGSAMADPFDTAVADITTKVTSYGGALVALSAVAVGFFIAIKFVKKIPHAA